MGISSASFVILLYTSADSVPLWFPYY